ncbi:DUF488 family protein [Prosthecobacter sp.]|uniref:DUF488 domain-containing protein n=1 Tax=Prosthecobacter sp. TaxID=1965333 RepID=UPI0024878298|nr:DUF488 family protein [Prosthecobacter sp.]MDI1315133.1 DUF488 family protein [Prosthecobacter sp.]
MPAIRTKCVWTAIDREHDGLRILVTRYTVRGCSGTRYNVWMPNLAPSEPLLKAYHAEKINWKEFTRRYKLELFEPALMDKENERIKNYGQKFTLRLIKELARRQPVTLLCQCSEDTDCCHRHLLKAVLESAKV